MIKLKSLLPLNEFKSFSNRFRNMDTIRIKDQREYKRIMKYLDKRGHQYYDIGHGKGEWHIQFDNTRETSRIRRELEKKRFKIIDPNTNEGKLTEGKWGTKGKYLTMPDGELSSIPGNNDRYAIAVYIGRDEFKIHMLKSKPYAYGPKYDKEFRNVNDLVKWLNKEKAKYAGIDNR